MADAATSFVSWNECLHALWIHVILLFHVGLAVVTSRVIVFLAKYAEKIVTRVAVGSALLLYLVAIVRLLMGDAATIAKVYGLA